MGGKEERRGEEKAGGEWKAWRVTEMREGSKDEWEEEKEPTEGGEEEDL